MSTAMERFVWIDVETTGLDHNECELLEIGFRITEVDFTLITQKDWVIWPGEDLDESGLNPFIWNMHSKSGLIEDVNNIGQPLDMVKVDVYEWLVEQEITKEDPLCGSSVRLDKDFFEHNMRAAHDLFSYRIIDLSSIKELCRRLNPDLYARLDKYSSKRELHRALPDLEDTCSEAYFYAENFLILGD